MNQRRKTAWQRVVFKSHFLARKGFQPYHVGVLGGVSRLIRLTAVRCAESPLCLCSLHAAALLQMPLNRGGGKRYVRPNQMQLLRADDSPAWSTRSLTYSGGSRPSISARSNLCASYEVAQCIACHLHCKYQQCASQELHH